MDYGRIGKGLVILKSLKPGEIIDFNDKKNLLVNNRQNYNICWPENLILNAYAVIIYGLFKMKKKKQSHVHFDMSEFFLNLRWKSAKLTCKRTIN